jgi:hypothetical protein
MPNTIRLQILRALETTWPAEWRLGTDLAVRGGHPLERTLRAFMTGQPSSLPHFSSSQITWCTIAQGPEELQEAIEDVRAWIVPSFGSELEIRTAADKGSLSTLLLALSPAGYFVWKSSRDHSKTVASKLETMLRLEEGRPAHRFVRVPSLLEMRQRFSIALTAGDRDSAERAVQLVDQHLLDTATNTQFMRVRIWDTFHDWHQLTTFPQLRDLVRVRMPHRVRVALVRGFHSRFLAPLEAAGASERLVETYALDVHPEIAGLLDLCKSDDGLEVRRCLAYRSLFLQNRDHAVELVKWAADPILAKLLGPVAEDGPPQDETEREPLVDQWRAAVGRNDIREQQEVGAQFLGVTPDPLGDRTLLDQLARTLEQRSNPGLAALLRQLSLGTVAEPLTLVPTSWMECADAFTSSRWEAIQKFLDADAHPSAAALSPDELRTILNLVEECFTDPQHSGEGHGGESALALLVGVINDLRSDPGFPTTRHSPLFIQLLRLFTARKRGSLHREDAAMFLLLADAVLQFQPRAEAEIVEEVRNWWDARRGVGLLPFLLEGLSVVVPQVGEFGPAESLWMQGAELRRRNGSALTPGEWSAWRAIGFRLQLTEETLDAYFPQSTAPDRRDPLAEAKLRKVAIVSLRERQAREAAKEIEKRSGATVVLVTETAAGPSARDATTADVILLVWSAVTHAVYRAFDGVRDRVAYVQGTGAESILLSLERELERR